MRCVYTGILFCCLVSFQYVSFSQEKEFEPYGTPILLVFGDYFYKAMGAEHTFSSAEFSNAMRDFQAFYFRRIYLGYQYHFSPEISAKIVLEGNDALRILNDARGLYVKYAYVWVEDLFPFGFPNWFAIGALATPTWNFSEKFYGYRFLERTLLDMRRMGSSNDVGAAIGGRFGKDSPLGFVLMIGNGRNGKFEDDKYKVLYGSIEGVLLNQKLWVQLYGDYRNFDIGVKGGIATVKGFVGFQPAERFRLGLEFGMQNTSYDDQIAERPQILNGTTFDDVLAIGVSGFLRYAFAEQLELFARADFFDPDNNQEEKYTEAFLVFGVRWDIIKNVTLMPNIWMNGYIAGGTMPETKVDVVPRLTFYFKN